MITVVELAELLTELISAQEKVTYLDIKGPVYEGKGRDELTIIRNGHRNAILDEFTLMKQQRDDLLAACKGLLLSADCAWEKRGKGHDWAESCEAARAAIARAEGDNRWCDSWGSH